MRNFNKRRAYGLFLTVLCGMSSIGTAAPAVFSMKEKQERAKDLEIAEKDVTFFNSGKTEAATHVALNLVFWTLVINALQLGVDGFTGATNAAKDVQDLENRTFKTKLKAAINAVFTKEEWNRHFADMKAVAVAQPNRDGITETLAQRAKNYVKAKPVFVIATAAQVVVASYLGAKTVKANNKLRDAWTAAENDYAKAEAEFTSAQTALKTVSGTADATPLPKTRKERRAEAAKLKTKTEAAQVAKDAAAQEVKDLATARAELATLGLANTAVFTTSTAAKAEKARVEALLAGTDLATLRGLKKLLTADKADELAKKIAALQTLARDRGLSEVHAASFVQRTLQGKTTLTEKLHALSQAAESTQLSLEDQNLLDSQRLNFTATLTAIEKAIEKAKGELEAKRKLAAAKREFAAKFPALPHAPRAVERDSYFDVPKVSSESTFSCEAESVLSKSKKDRDKENPTRSTARPATPPTPPAAPKAPVSGASGVPTVEVDSDLPGDTQPLGTGGRPHAPSFTGSWTTNPMLKPKALASESGVPAVVVDSDLSDGTSSFGTRTPSPKNGDHAFDGDVSDDAFAVPATGPVHASSSLPGTRPVVDTRGGATALSTVTEDSEGEYESGNEADEVPGALSPAALSRVQKVMAHTAHTNPLASFDIVEGAEEPSAVGAPTVHSATKSSLLATPLPAITAHRSVVTGDLLKGETIPGVTTPKHSPRTASPVSEVEDDAIYATDTDLAEFKGQVSKSSILYNQEDGSDAPGPVFVITFSTRPEKNVEEKLAAYPNVLIKIENEDNQVFDIDDTSETGLFTDKVDLDEWEDQAHRYYAASVIQSKFRENSTKFGAAWKKSFIPDASTPHSADGEGDDEGEWKAVPGHLSSPHGKPPVTAESADGWDDAVLPELEDNADPETDLSVSTGKLPTVPAFPSHPTTLTSRNFDTSFVGSPGSLVGGSPAPAPVPFAAPATLTVTASSKHVTGDADIQSPVQAAASATIVLGTSATVASASDDSAPQPSWTRKAYTIKTGNPANPIIISEIIHDPESKLTAKEFIKISGNAFLLQQGTNDSLLWIETESGNLVDSKQSLTDYLKWDKAASSAPAPTSVAVAAPVPAPAPATLKTPGGTGSVPRLPAGLTLPSVLQQAHQTGPARPVAGPVTPISVVFNGGKPLPQLPFSPADEGTGTPAPAPAPAHASATLQTNATPTVLPRLNLEAARPSEASSGMEDGHGGAEKRGQESDQVSVGSRSSGSRGRGSARTGGAHEIALSPVRVAAPAQAPHTPAVVHAVPSASASASRGDGASSAVISAGPGVTRGHGAAEPGVMRSAVNKSGPTHLVIKKKFGDVKIAVSTLKTLTTSNKDTVLQREARSTFKDTQVGHTVLINGVPHTKRQVGRDPETFVPLKKSAFEWFYN